MRKKNIKNITRGQSKVKLRKIVQKILSKKKKIKAKTKAKVVKIKPIVVEPVIAEKKKRRKKSPGIMYFTQDTEDAIVAFNKTEDHDEREVFYNTRIKYPFEKLVENIFNTFKFTYFETGPFEIQKETVAHLVANIQKYDPSKGKAFAYFSIVAKHYLIALNNSTYKRFNQHVDISEDRDENTVQLQSEDPHYKKAEMDEFMSLMVRFWENNVGKIFTKQRDLDIANAVIEMFRHVENISMFNKKALYLYIREISGCKTQQITKIINKMKSFQDRIQDSYINTGYISPDIYGLSKSTKEMV